MCQKQQVSGCKNCNKQEYIHSECLDYDKSSSSINALPTESDTLSPDHLINRRTMSYSLWTRGYFQSKSWLIHSKEALELHSNKEIYQV